MTDNTIMLTALYEDVRSALADLREFDHLHKREMIGRYNAAVVANRDGTPHIARRMDRPRMRVIPELLGVGTLPRKDLEAAARGLSSGEAALIVAGEPEVETGFDQAVSGATQTCVRCVGTDELASG